jgi:hypothetical protein
MDMGYLPSFQGSLNGFWESLANLRGFDDTRVGLNWCEPLDFIKSLRAVPFMISKSSSAAGVIKMPDAPDSGVLSTAPASLLAAVAVWLDNPEMYQVLKDWCMMSGNTWLINRIES